MASNIESLRDRRVTGATNKVFPEETLVTGDRYTSPDFMQAELDRMWPRVWNIGGWGAEIPEAGDFITHQLGRDSIIMMRQDDGSVRAFHNVCPHRGNRLIHPEHGSLEALKCSYHGWTFSRDGTLVEVQDPEDFPKGNPCGKLNLAEIQCEDWAGFIWYNIDVSAPSLSEFLGEVKDYFEAHALTDMTRTFYRVCEVDFNWKALHDNFCESYHLPTAHPELSEYFDDDYKNTHFELYETGHNLMKMKGCLPSLRDDKPDQVNEILAAELEAWELDPADFEGRAHEAREAVQKQKRALGPKRGFRHFENIEDAWLTDAFHFNIFPGTSITISAAVASLQRCEPHPWDPNKSIYEHWHMTIQPDEDGMTNSPVGKIPFKEAEKEVVKYGEDTLGFVADQDLRVATGQQLGFHDRGFKGAYLSGQENRIQQFHNYIDRYLEMPPVD